MIVLLNICLHVHLYILLHLGPRPNTVVDFWRMVWQEDSNRIVMVANISEMGKVNYVYMCVYVSVSVWVCVSLCACVYM